MCNHRSDGRRQTLCGLAAIILSGLPTLLVAKPTANKSIAYLSAKLDLPFWMTMSKGVQAMAEKNGYQFIARDSNLNAQTQLQHTRELIAAGVAGIVLSPTDSKTAPAVLELARAARIPVAIADIGTIGGEYVSYIKSDNYRGAYNTGTELARVMKEKAWQAEPYALITISLARKNGLDRTNGFRDAMRDAGLTREVALRQMQNYSAEETRGFVKEILNLNPNLRALFIETDQPVEGAMLALREAKKSQDVLIASFDAMPEVENMLTSGKLVAVGMQQPYLMGSQAAQALISALQGKAPAKQIVVPILVGSSSNIRKLMPEVNKNVFGK